MTPTPLMTAAECATWLRICVRGLRAKVGAGIIPAVRIGRSIRFDRETVLQALAKKTRK